MECDNHPTPPAAALPAAPRGRSRKLPEVSDRKRRAKWRLICLYVPLFGITVDFVETLHEPFGPMFHHLFRVAEFF